MIFPQYRGGNAAALAGWSPLALGSSLLAWWDAERADLITQSGGLVSSWKDIVGAYNATQAVGSSQPAYSATSFNNRPGITFDGVDDDVSVASITTLPTGTNAGEIWVLTDQTALAANTTTRFAVAYSGGATTDTRTIERAVVTGTNRAQGRVGNGSSSVSSQNASVDFSGRHVIRHIISASATQIDADAIAGSGSAVTPATLCTQLSIGRSSAGLTNYWQGVHNSVLFTTSLSAGQATLLYAFLNARK
jgi:hypothetical protein